jgi:hypothetical protein
MPARDQHDQAVKIRWEMPAPFRMDLIVRTPKNLQWRLEEHESFHTEIMTRGVVLYEKDDSGVGAEPWLDWFNRPPGSSALACDPGLHPGELSSPGPGRD